MYIYTYIYVYIHIYMVFATEGFYEAAIESWPEWGLNPTYDHWIPFRRFNRLSYQAMSWTPTIYIYIYIYIYVYIYIYIYIYIFIYIYVYIFGYNINIKDIDEIKMN